MPNAEEALKGMLADGVTPDDILTALKESGYSVEAPETEESGGPEKEEGMEIEIEMGPPNPMGAPPEDKRMDAAKKAMAKHGY